jgi:hypothetical protein
VDFVFIANNNMPCPWALVVAAALLFHIITAVPIIKLFAWGEGDSGGHVLREIRLLRQPRLLCFRLDAYFSRFAIRRAEACVD